MKKFGDIIGQNPIFKQVEIKEKALKTKRLHQNKTQEPKQNKYLLLISKPNNAALKQKKSLSIMRNFQNTPS